MGESHDFFGRQDMGIPRNPRIASSAKRLDPTEVPKSQSVPAITRFWIADHRPPAPSQGSNRQTAHRTD